MRVLGAFMAAMLAMVCVMALIFNLVAGRVPDPAAVLVIGAAGWLALTVYLVVLEVRKYRAEARRPDRKIQPATDSTGYRLVPEVLPHENEAAAQEVLRNLARRLAKHGPYAFAGPHETYGVLAEEVYELLEALRDNNAEAFHAELSDIAVVCLFGMATRRAHVRAEQEVQA